MDRAPLPPHERSWRHPSELGPPVHEPTPTGGRVIIATTAAVSLLLIGLMVVSITPDRAASPETASSAISSVREDSTPAALARPDVPVVTPLGAHGLAVTTLTAVTGTERSLRARLPDGAIHTVTVITTDEDTGLAVVQLPATARGDSYDLAAAEPAPSDTVLVNGQPPVVVPMDELAELDVDEGTPVLDDHGDLVGLCTGVGGAVALMAVATVPTTAPAVSPSTTVPLTTVRPTTNPPATTVPHTTAPPTTPPTTTTSVPSTVSPTTVSGDGDATSAPD